MAKTCSIIQRRVLLKFLLLVFIEFEVLIKRAKSAEICGDGFDRLKTKCYHLHQKKVTWDEAYSTCKQKQGYLLQLQDERSKADENILFQTLEEKKVSDLWTSLRRKQGYFQWLGESPQILRRRVNDTIPSIWGTKEPSLPSDDCASLQVLSKKFFSKSCTVKLQFVCLRPLLKSQLHIVPYCKQGWLGHRLIPNRCLLINPNTTTWKEAEAYCQNKNAFILSDTSYTILKNFSKQLDPFNVGIWLYNRSGDCVTSTSFNKVSCDKPTRSVCEMPQNLENLKIWLIVTISRNRKTDEPVIWVTRNEMSTLTLNCIVEISGRKLNVSNQEQFRYFWLKNGIYMESPNNRVIFPNQWRTPAPFDLSFGNITNGQGTFRCEVGLLGLEARFQSKDVTILLKDVKTSLLSITLSTDKPVTPYDLELSAASANLLLEWNHLVRHIFSDVTKRVNENDGFWWALQYMRPIEQEMFSAKIKNIILTGIVSTANFENSIPDDPLDVNNSDHKTFRTFIILKIISQPLDRCPDESYEINNITYVWNMIPEKSKSYSHPRCKSRFLPHRSVFRHCLIDFVSGVQWEPFNYKQCLEDDSLAYNDFCLGGFHSVNNETCIKEFIQDEEFKSYHEAKKTCVENNATLSLPFGDGKLYANGAWLNRETDGEVLLKFNNQFFYSTVFCPLYKPSIEESIKYVNCSERYPFICSKPRIMNSLAEVPWCHQGWLGSDWADLQDSCFFFYPTQDTNRNAAFERCQSRDAHLAVAFDDMTKQSLMNTVSILKKEKLITSDSGAFWIGLTKTNSGIYWNSSIASYKDEDIRINSNNSGGTMGFLNADPIQFQFTKSVKKNGYICQKQALTEKERHPRISLRKIENDINGIKRVKLICDGRRVHPNSFVHWYLNNDLMNTDSRIKGNEEVTTSIKRLMPNGRIIAELEFPLRTSNRQGQYHCVIGGSLATPTVSSDKILVILPGNKSLILFIELKTPSDGTKNEIYNVLRFLNDCSNISDVKFETVRLVTNFFDRQLYISFNHQTFEAEKIFERCVESMRTLLGVKKIEFRVPIGCLKETTQDELENTLEWPFTPLDSSAISNQVCLSEDGIHVSRQCLGDYVRGAKWGDVQGTCYNKGNEITLSLRILSKSNITHDSVSEKSSELLYLTKSAETLQPIDIHHIAETMQKIANIINVSEEVLNNAAKTIDYILSTENQQLEINNLRSNSSTRITEAFEKILENVQFQNDSNLALKLDSVYVQSYVPSKQDPVVGVASVYSVEGDEITRQVLPLQQPEDLNFSSTEAALLLPKNLLEELKYQNPEARVTFIVYENNRLFPAFGDPRTNQKINSRVISAKVPRRDNFRLNPPVTLVFRPLKPSLTSLDYVSCVFWDYTLNKGRGDWSEEGCWVSDFMKENIICQCNHLTNFAVLMDIEDQENSLSEEHRLALDMITYIGCSLSILGLVLTIITFATFKKWRKKDGNKVLCNLSISLLCVLVTFLGGIEQVDIPVICLVVAVLLHYFLLATFCWMLVEAVLQYLMFVRVFDTYIPRFIIKAMAFAWGVPLAIVITVLSIDINLYRGQHLYCWMSLQAQYYGFLLPLGIIITINTLVFIRVLKGISCDRKSTLRSNQSKRQLAIVQLNAATCIFVLLGLSWIFGFMTITKTNIVFHYLFCICNSLQGMTIFLFMVVRDKNAKDLWYAFLTTSKRTKPNLTMSSIRSTSSTGTKTNGHIRRS